MSRRLEQERTASVCASEADVGIGVNRIAEALRLRLDRVDCGLP